NMIDLGETGSLPTLSRRNVHQHGLSPASVSGHSGRGRKSMKTIEIKPLTREAFAPFGQVIEQDGAHNFPINAGKCVRYHDLAHIETTGEKARPMISLLRGEPY